MIYPVIATVNGHYLTDCSLSWPLNGGITWSAVIPYKIDINHAEDLVYTLCIASEIHSFSSPPLVASIRSISDGRGIGEKTEISGTDRTSFLASKEKTDLPVFLGQYSDDIVNAIAASVGVTVLNCPRYKIAEFKANKGKAIEHIARILHDGGYGYKITRNGDIYGFPLNAACGNGCSYGTTWIATTKETRSAADKVTAIEIVKTSPLQSHYEFIFERVGFYTVNFTNPLDTVAFRDASTYGYIDEIAFFNGDVASGAKVGNTITTMPHPGMTYPQGLGAPPISSASLQVYAPVGALTEEMMAIAIFDGVPHTEAWYEQITLAFKCTYDTGVTPARPAPDYIDGTIMPSLEHAQAIAPALLFDMNKGCHTFNFTYDDPVCCFEPGESVRQNVRVDNMSFSLKSGTTLDCVVIE